MVRKKHQNDPQDNDSSTESCDEKRSNNSQGSGNSSICPHVKRAVDSTKLRKILKSDGILKDSCSECSKADAEAAVSTTDGSISINEKTPNDDGFEYDKTLWLCLKCGTQLCGRSKNKHALHHFTTPHSDCHALAMNTTTLEIWCYECDDEVKPSVRKNLLECVETIKRMSQKSQPQVNSPMEEEISKIGNRIAFDLTPKSLSTGESLIGNMNNQPLAIGGISSMPSTSGPLPFPGIAQRIHTVDTLPRVRGLSNLGNTCFFNAVLQCLAQTPYLVDVLKEASAAGEKFVLPGGTFQFGEEEELELPSIQGVLSSWGDITSALANTLEELQSGGGVYNPCKLFGKLTHKCPQFRGGDQHDSHELLRHLLESVRSEDLRRYQSVILDSLGCSRKQDPSLASNDIKQKCKIYGNQAADRILLPEKVFRGFLVSTLTCQECYHNSSRHESFLDLSLPVSVEKPHPPNRRKNSPENSPTTIGGPSKHQLKKEKEKERKAKRAAKRNNKRIIVKSSIGPAGDNAMAISPVKDQPNLNSRSGSSSSSSSEQSDADVEDNLIEDAPKFASGTQSINRSIPPLYDANGNNEFINPIIPEKRGDSPENLYKDSNDDGNDSGIATSPANTAVAEQDSKDIAFSPIIGPMSEEHYLNLNDSENIKAKNVVLELGISERGANLIKQRSLMGEELLDNGKTASSPEGDTYVPGGMEFLSKYNNSNDEDLIVDPQECQTGCNSKLSNYLKYLSLKNFEDDSCETGSKKLKAKRVRTQSHSDWSNTMAPRYQCEDGECSVQSCLNNFTTIELMTDNNKVGCDGCTKRINGENGKTVYTNATKQFLISSPPAVLILHLKRFQVERRMFKKLTRDVNFPMLLDIAPFCGSRVKYLPNIDRKQKKLIYALYGIVEHSGGMYGGHYTAYVKVRAKLSSNDPRWKFLPQGSKAELDQIDEQRAKLDELLAKEQARELRMKENDSDDFTSSNTSASSSTSSSSSSSEPDSNEEVEGAVGGSNDSEIKELPGKWYYVSDSHVQEVTEKRVLEAQAYLLFYERIY